MSPRFETRRLFASILLVSFYFFAVGSPVILAIVAVPQTDHSFLSELAKNSGLVAIGILLAQFVLATHLRVVCNVFSLSDVMIFHRSMRIFAFALLSLHPILLSAGEGDWSLLFGWNQSWYIWAGKLGLLLLLLHILVSLFRAALKLSYERWRILHNCLALTIIALGLLHSWFAGGDLQTWQMRALWFVLGLIASLVFVWHRFIRPIRLANQAMHVAEVRQETSDVWRVQVGRVPIICRLNFISSHFLIPRKFLSRSIILQLPRARHSQVMLNRRSKHPAISPA